MAKLFFWMMATLATSQNRLKEPTCCESWESSSSIVLKKMKSPSLWGRVNGPEWPSPHDCTSFVWDEFKFIPIIGFTACIEVGSIPFFPLTYFKATHKKNLFYCPNISNLNYLPPPIKNPKPQRHSRTKTMFQKMVLRWCYKSNGEVLLQKTMLHKCVEAMLKKRCWNNVIEDVAKVVLQKTLLQKKLVHLWQISVHQPFFYLFFFHSCFFAQM